MAYGTNVLVTRFGRHLSLDGEQYRFHPVIGSADSIPITLDEVEYYTYKLENRGSALTRLNFGLGIVGLLLVYYGMFTGRGDDLPIGWIIGGIFAVPLLIATQVFGFTVKPLMARAEAELRSNP